MNGKARKELDNLETHSKQRNDFIVTCHKLKDEDFYSYHVFKNILYVSCLKSKGFFTLHVGLVAVVVGYFPRPGNKSGRSPSQTPKTLARHQSVQIKKEKCYRCCCTKRADRQI